MDLEKAQKIAGTKNPDIAKSMLNHVTLKAPLKLKIALLKIANKAGKS